MTDYPDPDDFPDEFPGDDGLDPDAPALIWEPEAAPGYATVQYLEGVEDVWELKRGLSVTERFPDDAAFRMNPAFPREVRLPDVVYNLDSLLVVARDAAKDVGLTEAPHIELLDVAVYNHKGRLAERPYVIVNPLGTVDCLDLEASEVEMNPVDPDLVSVCRGLVLDPGRLDPERPVFRPTHLPTRLLVTPEWMGRLQAGAPVGSSFWSPGTYAL